MVITGVVNSFPPGSSNRLGTAVGYNNSFTDVEAVLYFIQNLFFYLVISVTKNLQHSRLKGT